MSSVINVDNYEILIQLDFLRSDDNSTVDPALVALMLRMGSTPEGLVKDVVKNHLFEPLDMVTVNSMARDLEKEFRNNGLRVKADVAIDEQTDHGVRFKIIVDTSCL